MVAEHPRHLDDDDDDYDGENYDDNDDGDDDDYDDDIDELLLFSRLGFPGSLAAWMPPGFRS